MRNPLEMTKSHYHSDTAKIYTDFGLLTCDEDLCNDVTELFNYLTTGFKPRRKYTQLLTAPRFLKQALLSKIEREIERHRIEKDGHIQFKVNALEDPDITRALYQASRTGVSIDLIVRDTCRIRPGITGLSETIRVVSLVGRFLEHSRVYYFKNGGSEEYFISSADAMRRNLEARVEILCPITSSPLKNQIRAQLDLILSDTRSTWWMNQDGTYQKHETTEDQRTPALHIRMIEQIVIQHQQYRKSGIKKRNIH